MKSNYNEIIRKNTELETNRLLLRKFNIKDKEAVLAYGSDSQTLKYLVWTGITDPNAAERVIMAYYSKPGVYAVALKENDLCIGCIDIRIEPQHEKASFGYVLNRNYWNHGYMTEALTTILNFCFTKLELNRVEATHYMGNEGSGRVMKKNGMRLEGVAIEEVKIKGKFHDVVHYGITKAQWEETAFI
ncbi:GNAT family N-acetyltransferase [Anaerocolumna sedimenticola]|uniref:GNAT family N-acetyltransferase n=1 Tax=Anaerocolumna sedimenticola TaxID=2696063 RepID=A0A6P1TST2_9FIRM|nr:GNAT family protein [Anaerocolumna sedimenticola]QHQ63543.1 GNAT family N-acetyltransferase [Anaerocolumna sedimenticola]